MSEPGASPVRHVIASLIGKELRGISSTTNLRSELAIDSLLAVELLSALEAQLGLSLDGAELARCETVGDLEALVAKSRAAASSAIEVASDEEPEKEPIKIPAPIAERVKRALTMGQMGFYANVMRPKVYGRAYIPHNRNTIVASNHTSHLDMGFVKYALGSYGEDLVSLAAQDYFFEGNRWRRAYFENFTNLAAFDRKGGLRQALRMAGDHLEQGRTVLIFPEGTRSPDGAIQEFKPAIGHLALQHGVDILPVYLGGTFEAMRKGSKIPTKRDITAHIGLPLEVSELRRLTEGMKLSAASKKIAQLTEQAVRMLREGKVLDLRTLDRESDAMPAPSESPIERLFRDLEGRFRADRVEKPVTFYFTLGVQDDAKWTLKVAKDGCSAQKGKPEGGVADCVLKTSPEIFTRIVKEAYVPSPMEFLSGAVKSNDISLLQTFQKVFDLS